jgi:two-component system, NtrC family, response regulator HydG
MIGRILVVDDDKDHAESIVDLLELRGYGVEAAHSGEDALELFARRPFDLTIMDVKLPGINGVETFFQLRKTRPGAQAIMMTGLNLDELIASAVGNGVAEILRKPFAMADLINAITAVWPDGLVLAADSDAAFGKTIAEFLDANGYAAAAARSRHDISELIPKELDCLILDLGTPILAGIEAYLDLRAHGGSVPTILVSSCNDQVPDQLAQEQILIKPFDPVLLVEAVKTALEPRRVEAA